MYKLNGLDCGGWQTKGADAVEFSMACGYAEVSGLKGAESLKVTDGDGTELADFSGYELVSQWEVDGAVRARFLRKLEANMEAAIRSLEANMATVSKKVEAGLAEAGEAAQGAKDAAKDAKQAAETAQAAANPQVVTFASIALPSMAASITDEQAVAISTLWPEWSAGGVQYKVDDVVNHGGHLYRCEQAHTSQADWTPDAAASMWSQIDIAGDGVDVWTQPTGAHNAYNTGDRVHYPTADDPIYVSLINGNTWSPDAYPQGWKLEQSE